MGGRDKKKAHEWSHLVGSILLGRAARVAINVAKRNGRGVEAALLLFCAAGLGVTSGGAGLQIRLGLGLQGGNWAAVARGVLGSEADEGREAQPLGSHLPPQNKQRPEARRKG